MVIETPRGGRAATRITDIPCPSCGEHQVILKVMAASICQHCEAEYDQGKLLLSHEDSYPVVLGHEFSGEVVELGTQVRGLKLGERVAVDNTVLCGECYYCKRDEPLYCENFGSLGHNLHGGFEQYVAVNAEKAFLIPDSISYEAAACIEPVACCLRAIDRMQLRYGDNVAVLGAGPMGMILAQLAKHSNAGEVVVLGSTQYKLDICEREFGVKTVLVDRSDSAIHEAKIRELFPHGLDGVFDTTGSNEMNNSAMRMLGRGGKLVWYSHVPQFHVYDDDIMMMKELSIIVSSCQTHNYQRCLDAVARGHVRLQPLITHEFSLEDYLEALDTNIRDRRSIKVILHPHWEKGRRAVHLPE